MHLRHRHRITLAAVLVLGATAGVIAWITRPAQVTISLTPLRSLSTQACAAEVVSYGYSTTPADAMCMAGTGSSWYHAVLLNRGSYTQITCTATAYDPHGRVVYQGMLPFTFGGIRGLFAGHGTTSFNWYLPAPTLTPPSRYVTACTALPYP